ncbi:MAG: response regulator, partial [Butyricicoccus sp.]|nr:response regulator [Butyricicoccus sp.]
MNGTILLAEDDRALSALITDFVTAADIAVVPVYDGAAAIAAAAEHRFDLLVLDVMMPEYTGLEVCRTVRASSDVPVVFLTALGQEADAIAGYRAGADDYI